MLIESVTTSIRIDFRSFIMRLTSECGYEFRESSVEIQILHEFHWSAFKINTRGQKTFKYCRRDNYRKRVRRL